MEFVSLVCGGDERQINLRQMKGNIVEWCGQLCRSLAGNNTLLRWVSAATQRWSTASGAQRCLRSLAVRKGLVLGHQQRLRLLLPRTAMCRTCARSLSPLAWRCGGGRHCPARETHCQGVIRKWSGSRTCQNNKAELVVHLNNLELQVNKYCCNTQW